MIEDATPSGFDAPPPPTDGEETPAGPSAMQSRPIYRGLTERGGFFADRSAWITYPSAIILSCIAVGVRRWIDALGPDIEPFVLFFPVVLVCTLFGGKGPGLLSLGIASVASIFLWLEPLGVLPITKAGAISLALFVISNAVIIIVADRLRTTLDRLRQSEARLSLSQEAGRIGLWDLNLKTGALWWSPPFRELTGIGAEHAPSLKTFISHIDEADRERTIRDFANAYRGYDRLDNDFRFNRDDSTSLWLASRAELFRDADGNPARLLGIVFDATPIRTAERQRDHANSLLRTFFESLPGAAFVKDCDGRYLLGNPIFEEAIGHPNGSYLGKTDLEVLKDNEQARAIMASDKAIIAGGEPRQMDESLVLPDGEMSHWIAVKAPFLDATGQPQGIMGLSLDVTERHKADERLRFLADEVDHRAKNLLGVVIALVRLTKVEDVSAFKAAVTGRIEALARAHTLLAANRWQGVNIAALVHEELEPFRRAGTERICCSGPSLMLEPNAAQALAMAVHELAINAGMHGALSVEEGRLTVAWELNERGGDNILELHWTEAGGPEVTPPTESGFGSTAMRGAIEHQLGGELDLDWAPSGVTCRIAFPIARGAASATVSAGLQRADPSLAGPSLAGPPLAGPPLAGPPLSGVAAPALDLAGLRVLVLEDEALIALTLVDMLQEFGCTVVGPANSAPAALEMLEQVTPDLAILDVNLAGSSSAPVAQVLRSRSVPFVYCTGYAEPTLQIEPDLLAPMLTKPVNTNDLAEALRKAIGDQRVSCEA